MTSVHEAKRGSICETPILLFECKLGSGAVERWSTHRLVLDGTSYDSRVLKHNLLEMRSGAEGGVDAYSRLTVTLANADSYFSQITRNTGWKGAKLSVRFVFFDLKEGSAASESTVVFRGIANPPDEITESTIRLTFTSRMNLQRILLPQVRIQRRCPWMFPSTAEQRVAAKDGGSTGSYSPFHRCGYSPDVSGGFGNLDGGQAFSSCNYTRTHCIERGMFDKDTTGRETRRFGGIEFVPSTIEVKSYGEKGTHSSSGIDNEAKYNDFVPMVYGTAWYRPPVVFARNDGNLTHMEVLLGVGEIESVLRVVVNGNELPPGTTRSEHITSTGWFNIVTLGARTGAFNLDFKNGAGDPVGDPYGSMAVLSVVVPNRISDGDPLPRVDVLLQGLKLATFDEAGESTGSSFTNNPAWVLLDLLRRSGWDLDEVDVRSFARAAAYCAESIDTVDIHGNPQSVSRFQCNLVMRKRRSAADVIRGVRNGSGLYLTYGIEGLLELHAESSFAVQNPEKPEGSNSNEDVNSGWPSYEFGDGSTEFSDIRRRDNGEPSLRVWSRTTAESPNRYSVEFQDEFNEYQQDSLSLVDLEDAVASGEEVAASLLALGIPNFSQAGRVLRLHLDRSLRGNTYIDFETGIRGLGLKPGDLITVTYAKEGFARQPFRIIRVSPSLNYTTIAITAQVHEDTWYVGEGDDSGLAGGGRQTGTENGLPRPLAGDVIDQSGDTQFTVQESSAEGTDGSYDLDVAASFAQPGTAGVGAPSIPLVSLAAQLASTSGSLKGGETYYYGITGVQDGMESPLSFLVRATVPQGSNTNTVTLNKLSFAPDTTAFNVYRGKNPMQLLRIASGQETSPSFVDDGKQPEPISPPDPNFDHANFYWRLELQPETTASIHSESTIGAESLGMNPNEYRGKIVRIIGGKGKGQERMISSNTATALTISKNWEVVPDDDSVFVVAEPAWTFGAESRTSPAMFRVPNRFNTTIHISGRAANAHGRECAMEVSPLTRHTIGGAAADRDVAQPPLFGLRTLGQGLIEIGGIGFEDLENTRSISAVNLTLHYWDELSTVTPLVLNSPLDGESTTLELAGPGSAQIGSILQIGTEIVVVQAASNESQTYTVDRGSCGSQAVGHEVGEPVWQLKRRTSVFALPPRFFGSPASGSYTQTLTVPDIRVVAAEMSVTNVRGTSQVKWASYANTPELGLRTLSGGQVVLQVDGPVAVQSSAVPAIVMDASHAVRDVCATLTEAPSGSVVELRITLDGAPLCTLTIPDGETTSNVVNGTAIPYIAAGARIGLDVVTVGQTWPGAGLSVSIRF
jgi:hypothetical protein